jgi:uncharacterized protein YbaR (Trm112 family)
MRRTFGLDVLACPWCGGRLRLVALIEQASAVQRILRRLGLRTEVPEPRPARAPRPRLEPLEDQSGRAPEFDAAWHGENGSVTPPRRVRAPTRRSLPGEREDSSCLLYCHEGASVGRSAVHGVLRRGAGSIR